MRVIDENAIISDHFTSELISLACVLLMIQFITASHQLSLSPAGPKGYVECL